MDKINVNLYGGKSIFGKRETRLEADEIYCDSYEKCSFYKKGMCLNCRTFIGDHCKKGVVNTIEGYTSKAKKYSEFYSKYKNDSVYAKLHYPSNTITVARIDDYLWLNTTYVAVRKATEQDKSDYRFKINEWGYIITTSIYSTGYIHIPMSDITVDFLNAILSYVPCHYGKVAVEYQQNIVPNIVTELKEIFPEIYKELIEKYPHYKDYEPNYIGKYAFISTMVNGCTLTDKMGNKALLKDGKLYLDEYKGSLLPFGGKHMSAVIEVDEQMVYQITDNSQCDRNTRFR